VLSQHLVSSLAVRSYSVHRLRADVEDYNVIYYYRINKLCINLVIETSLQYDARSEKHQITVILLYEIR